MEQGLVPVVERRETDVPLKVVRLAPDMLQLEGDLDVDVHDPRRQQPAQPQLVALIVGEGGVLVEERVREQRGTAQGDRRWTDTRTQGVEHGARRDVGMAARRGRGSESHDGSFRRLRSIPPRAGGIVALPCARRSVRISGR